MTYNLKREQKNLITSISINCCEFCVEKNGNLVKERQK